MSPSFLTLQPIFLALLAVYRANATPGLSLNVQAPRTVDGLNSLKVTTTVTNSGDETLKILNHPNGPLSLMNTNTFSITNAGGASPAFTGIKVKYSAEKAAALNALTQLAPGESVSLTHDLSTTYNFTITGAGEYTFAANPNFQVVNDDGTISPLVASVEPSVSIVDGRLAIPKENVGSLTKRETFIKCSASQEASLTSAATAAQAYAASALSYLTSHTSSTSRFTTWFGSFTTSDHSTVTNHFSNLNSNNYSSYTFDCSCTAYDVYAYSYPDTFGKVYLCGAFWVAPPTGTDSQAGTLIHESTHFTKNAATQDYAYGQDDAQALAKSDPSEAIMNADNHEYFAENNPTLS